MRTKQAVLILSSTQNYNWKSTIITRNHFCSKDAMNHILSKAQFTQLHISKVPQKRSITHPTTEPLSPSKIGRFNWTYNPKNSKVTKARLPPASFPFFLKSPAAAGSRSAHTPLSSYRPRPAARAGAMRHRAASHRPLRPAASSGHGGNERACG